jgi:membrane-associated phospholipid phosphatase
MCSFCSARGAGLAVCLGLVVVALHSVRVAAQTAPGSESDSNVLMPGDSMRAGANAEYTPEWHAVISKIPGDWLRFARIAFTSRYAPTMEVTAVATVALVAADEPIWRRTHQWYTGSSTVKFLSDKVEYLGDGRPQFGLAAAFAAYGLVFGDSRAFRTGSEIAETILASGTVVQVLKHITGRESPFVSTRYGGRWDLFPNQVEYAKHVPRYDAFPSGHVTTLLASVTVVIENYPEWWWARPVGYASVVGLAVAMGNTGIHWYGDYPLEMGGLECEPNPGETKFSVAPLLEPDRAGIILTLSF